MIDIHVVRKEFLLFLKLNPKTYCREYNQPYYKLHITCFQFETLLQKFVIVLLLFCLFVCLFVFSEEGEVFSWGSGYGGKLGQGHLRDRSTPLRVAALKDMKVTKLACHEFHTAAVCGKVITQELNLKELLSATCKI